MKFLADVNSVSKVRSSILFWVVLSCINVLAVSPGENGRYAKAMNETFYVESDGYDSNLIRVTIERYDDFSLEISAERGDVVMHDLVSSSEYGIIVGSFVGDLMIDNEFVDHSEVFRSFVLYVDEFGNVNHLEVLSEEMVPVKVAITSDQLLSITAVRVDSSVINDRAAVRSSYEETIVFMTGEVVHNVEGGEPPIPTEDDPDGVEESSTELKLANGVVEPKPHEDDPDGKRSNTSQTFNLVQIPGVGQVLIIR